MKILEAINEYLENLTDEDYSSKTIKKYKSDLISFVFEYINDDIDIKLVDMKMIIGYLNYLYNKKNLAISTIKQKRQVIGNFFNYLFDEKIIRSNPYENLKNRQLRSLINK